MNNELRKEISKILVKWSMPTRQVAIDEILSLFQKEHEKLIEVIDNVLRDALGVFTYDVIKKEITITLKERKSE